MLLNLLIIQKYGIYGMSNADLVAVIRANPGKRRLVELCVKQIKYNTASGRE